MTVDFEDEFLRASGTLSLNVFGFFGVDGDFAISKRSENVLLTDGTTVDTTTTKVEALTIGANDVSAFVGVNGPASNPGAMGLSLTGVDFAIVLFKIKAEDDSGTPAVDESLMPTDQRTWTTVKASVTGASFIGIDDLTLSVSSLTVELNQKGGGIKTAATDTTFATANAKVVAYASSFDNDTSGGVTSGDGLVVATGSPDDLCRVKNSHTGKALAAHRKAAGLKEVVRDLPRRSAKRKQTKGAIEIVRSRCRNSPGSGRSRR